MTDYQLEVRGVIGDRFAADQAQLHGVLERIQDLGIELVSINPLPKGPS